MRMWKLFYLTFSFAGVTKVGGGMKQDFQPTVYIMASRLYGTIYTGVTSNLMQRVHQHREGSFEGFSKENGTKILVWFEQQGTMELAIAREKRIKN
jgi:putative endonuclease